MERYRIHAEAAVYYLTYSIVEWLPVFVSQASCEIVVDSLTFCHREKALCINAYVMMPTHMHLIVFDADLILSAWCERSPIFASSRAGSSAITASGRVRSAS
jgi:hypothetical protein